MITVRRSIRTPAPQRLAVTAPSPLQSGVKLTASEFLRRFDAMPVVKRAELINGIVYTASPERAKQHGIPDNRIQTWLGTYSAHTPGTYAAASSTVSFDADNLPQPDALLMIESGGRPGSTRMSTSTARRNSWSRSPPATSRSIFMRSWMPTAVRASRSASPGTRRNKNLGKTAPRAFVARLKQA